MTIKVIIECNVFGCPRSIEVPEQNSADETMQLNGWKQDPENRHVHFCDICTKNKEALFNG